jgi:hypothetical protein
MHFDSRLFRRRFSDPAVGPNHNLVSQNPSIARMQFQGKPKGESVEPPRERTSERPRARGWFERPTLNRRVRPSFLRLV